MAETDFDKKVQEALKKYIAENGLPSSSSTEFGKTMERLEQPSLASVLQKTEKARDDRDVWKRFMTDLVYDPYPVEKIVSALGKSTYDDPYYKETITVLKIVSALGRDDAIHYMNSGVMPDKICNNWPHKSSYKSNYNNRRTFNNNNNRRPSDGQAPESITNEFVNELVISTKAVMTNQLHVSGRRYADYGNVIYDQAEQLDGKNPVFSTDHHQGLKRERQVWSGIIECKGPGARYDLREALGQAAYYAFLKQTKGNYPHSSKLLAVRADVEDRDVSIHAQWGLWDGSKYGIEEKQIKVNLVQEKWGERLELVRPADEGKLMEFIDRFLSLGENPKIR